MKKSKSFLCLLLFSGFAVSGQKLTPKWKTDSLFKTPEATYYHAGQNIIFVANINGVNVGKRDGDGFISRLKPDGAIEALKWVTGLNDPKGMGVLKNSLFVADLTELVEIDVKTGKILNKFEAPGVVMLNDVSVSAKGEVFTSDSRGHKIYRYFEGKIEIWLDDPELKNPNGVFTEKEDLIVASAGTGRILRIDYKTKKQTLWANANDTADGIVVDKNGNYWISCWKGEIYQVSKDGKSKLIVDTKADKINSADTAYIKKDNLLVVPTFYKNSVIAYTIE